VDVAKCSQNRTDSACWGIRQRWCWSHLVACNPPRANRLCLPETRTDGVPPPALGHEPRDNAGAPRPLSRSVGFFFSWRYAPAPNQIFVRIGIGEDRPHLRFPRGRLRPGPQGREHQAVFRQLVPRMRPPGIGGLLVFGPTSVVPTPRIGQATRACRRRTRRPGAAPRRCGFSAPSSRPPPPPP